MNIPKACLFDLDGVLLDTEPIHEKAWQESAMVYGNKLTKNQLNSLKGKRRVDCAKEIVNLLDKCISINSFLETHQSIVSNLMRSPNTIEGAENLVRSFIKYKIPVALVTSSSRTSFNIKSQSHNWLNIFEIKVLGDDPEIKEGKPSPDPYLLAAKRLSVNALETWAIEDSISGMKSAIDAGCLVWYLKNKKDFNSDQNHKIYNIDNKLKNVTSLNSIEKELDLLIQSL